MPAGGGADRRRSKPRDAETCARTRADTFFEKQAILLGRALEVIPQEQAWVAPETGRLPASGAFNARILEVDPGGKTITVDRMQFFTGTALAAAHA